jgi:SAM-dependent methyltransferase
MPEIFGLRENYSWLGNLPSRIESIVNFGCYSCVEPFKLLWTLDAKEITVVEINERNIEELRKKEDAIKQRFPESLQDRKLKCICGDMTTHLSDLPDQYYDLAYCEDVLYLFQDVNILHCGISQMIRVVKHEGFIIAVETEYGVQYKTHEAGKPVFSFPPIPMSKPKDMDKFFLLPELKKIDLLGSPHFSYCFQKKNE